MGCLSICDQNVNSIARGLRMPPGLNVVAEHRKKIGGSLPDSLPRRAREPRQEQGSGSSANLEGQKQLLDLLEISSILCQVAARRHPDDHDEN